MKTGYKEADFYYMLHFWHRHSSAQVTNKILEFDRIYLLRFNSAMFITGFSVNNLADTKLINLRKKGNSYQILRDWLFEYISCPNHLGEIIEWLGFAILALNPAAWSFAVWTFCNLAPRAYNHHTWYKEHFSDYPKDRKVVIPGVW